MVATHVQKKWHVAMFTVQRCHYESYPITIVFYQFPYQFLTQILTRKHEYKTDLWVKHCQTIEHPKSYTNNVKKMIQINNILWVPKLQIWSENGKIVHHLT